MHLLSIVSDSGRRRHEVGGDALGFEAEQFSDVHQGQIEARDEDKGDGGSEEDAEAQ